MAVNGDILRQMASDPRIFREHLRIGTDDGVVPLGQRLDDWQRRDFESLDDGWRRAIGQSVDGDAVGRGYLERPRGHSKTSDLAVMATWALAFGRGRISGAAAAGDRDQARLLRDAVDRLVTSNPWLRDVLDVQQYRVVNTRTGSTLEILSADSNTSYGLLLDFLLVDEITNWRDAGEQLWIALYSGVAKRANCLCVVISNAGMGLRSSWQWKIREQARTSAAWCFSRLDGPQASWISESLLAEQKAMLPATAFDRLVLNRWTTGAGDALFEADIVASVVLDGPLSGPEKDWVYAAGLDLGLSRDASALIVIGKHVGGRNPTGKIRLAHVQSWKPRPGLRVSVESIEAAVLKVHGRFKLKELAYDPWQSSYLAERLTKQGIATREVNFTSRNLQEMATAVIEAFSERAIELWGHDELLSDLRSLRVVEKSYGWRLEPQQDASGHGDRAIGLSLALLAAKELDRFAVHSWGGHIWLSDSGPFGRRSGHDVSWGR